MNKYLEDLGVVLSGKDYKNNPPGDIIPIYGTGGIMGYTSIPLYSGPSVLTGRKGTINRPIYVEGDFWNVDTIFCIKAKNDVDTKWLYYCFLNTDLSKLNEATGVPSVSSRALYKLKFKWFELPLQCQISTILSTSDAVLEKTEAAIAKYKSIKYGMLQDLFSRGIDTTTGKLRPRYQDAPELYKKSKLGWIPKEWEVERLEEVCDVRDGTHDSPKYLDYGIPFITSKNLKDNEIDFTDVSYISDENHKQFSQRSKVECGDILFAMIGTIGNPVLINFDLEFSIKNVALLKFGSTKELYNEFAIQVLKSNIILEQFNSKSDGGVQSFVSLSTIRGLYFPIPADIEQREISMRLKAIDKKLQTEQEFLHKQQQIKAGLMNDLLSGKKKTKIIENQIA